MIIKQVTAKNNTMKIEYIKASDSYQASLGKRVLARDTNRVATIRKALARMLWLRFA